MGPSKNPAIVRVILIRGHFRVLLFGACQCRVFHLGPALRSQNHNRQQEQMMQEEFRRRTVPYVVPVYPALVSGPYFPSLQVQRI